MQISHAIHTGDLVEIRRGRWRVVDICGYDRCQLLTVAGIGPHNHGVERRFLTPFDTARPAVERVAPRVVRPERWRRACRALLADCGPPASLRAARAASIDLYPHQLEPALALVHGRGSRLLLADDVGLGKTIQAGLAIAELRARGLADRVLIVTPAGLRDQWRTELGERFAFAADVVDAGELRRRVARLPIGANPWTTIASAVVSVDFVKRPDVLPAVLASSWDVVVVDEAHGAGRDSERLEAVMALAARAGYVLLLTATPHNGDPVAFRSLCAIGAYGDPLIVFRRTKHDAKVGVLRRVHTLHVRPNAGEAHMHRALATFANAVRTEHESRDAWLALAVLHKRAFSSARALELTVGRRIAALAPLWEGGVQQLELPLDDLFGEADTADEAPDCLASLALGDPRRERRLLRALLDAARIASGAETKMRALGRLLARLDEPAIVFTEFRDTLLALHAACRQPSVVLHGGMSRDERTAALAAFGDGRARVLFATDAAGEGLNLHARCRVVINLELPWNPTRLEQRIGRVDRIGQRRIVHAFHFVARESGELRVLERLKARIARARDDIGAADPIADVEHVMARLVIDGPRELVQPHEDVRASHPPEAGRGERFAIDLRAEAIVEAARLARARRIANPIDAAALNTLAVTGPWIARSRWRRTHWPPGRGIAILRVDIEDGQGRVADWVLVALRWRRSGSARLGTHRIEALVRAAVLEWQRRADEASTRDCFVAVQDARRLIAVRLDRERQIALSVTPRVRSPRQHGLFDRRGEREAAADHDGLEESLAERAQRLAMWQQREHLTARPARLLFVLAS